MMSLLIKYVWFCLMNKRTTLSEILDLTLIHSFIYAAKTTITLFKVLHNWN